MWYNIKTTGERLMTWKSILGLGMALFLIGGMMLFAAPAAAQTIDNNLAATDIDSLLYMREEEKLAHDVYVTLYNLWGAPLFNNIANSEQVHTDMVLSLLTQYGLVDPVMGNGVGVFANQDLQALYNDLVSQGSQSYADALLVGGLIEEVDIADLQAELNTTDVLAIQQVYLSLLNGSSNHLTAFATTYENVTGLAYTPQYLSAAEVTAVLGSGYTPGNGNSNGARGGNGRGGNGNNNGQGNYSQMNRPNRSNMQNGSGGSGVYQTSMM